MIGFYDYTVVLTYISLACSVFGITQAIEGKYFVAIICLAMSGLFDMFDGKIARTKKNRTADEKLFGVQIDSLCDVVCFGVFPAIIYYSVAGKGILTSLLLSYYCICSVIRLGFFNVLETNRQRTEDGTNKYYHGLPITSISVLLPVFSLAKFFVNGQQFVVVLFIGLFMTGSLFIINFRIKKPSNAKLAVLVSVTGCVICALLLMHVYQKKSTSLAKTGTVPVIENVQNMEAPK